MKILINDLMQYSDLENDLKSPSLADEVPYTGELTINFDIPDSQGDKLLNCIGIGGSSSTKLLINGEIEILSPFRSVSGNIQPFRDGLYILGQTIAADTITIDVDGGSTGRYAAGLFKEMAISPTREPGFKTTAKVKRNAAGQQIQVLGNYGYEVIGVDLRYKITRDIYTEFQRAYQSQTMLGFPFFLDFENDDWIPVNKFYGQIDQGIVFSSAVNGFKYSKRFEFNQAL